MCLSSALFGQSGCVPFFFAEENTKFSAWLYAHSARLKSNATENKVLVLRAADARSARSPKRCICVHAFATIAPTHNANT